MNAAGRPTKSRTTRHAVLALAGLALAVFIVHGWSLNDGLFFDDHWHRATLRDYPWTPAGLTEAATFDLPGPLNNLWWQEQPLQWRYARPVSMLAMKVEYVITGGNPIGVHAAALIWHWATAALVFALALWALGSAPLAFFAGVVFVINGHAVYAVSWIAARNALVGGCLFAAAVLCYAIAAHGWRPAARVSRETPRLRAGWMLAAAGLWLAALFARESAVIFAPLVLVIDWSLGGFATLRRRWKLHALLALATAVYLGWRLLIFPNRDAPNIYFTTPEGPAYVLWALTKLAHLLVAQIWQTPMFLGVGTGVEAMQLGWQHVALGVMLLLAFGVYAWAARREPTALVWPTWLLLGFLPVVPVFIMPHFSYLPAIAYAVMLAVLVRRLRGVWRPVVVGLIIAGMLWTSFVYRVTWRGVVRSEQLLYADIRETTPTLPEGAQLFFINWPIGGIYAPVALREKYDQPDITGHVLTFAPHPLMMTQPSTLTQLDERTLLLETAAPGYFAGLTGRMLINGMRGGEALQAGDVVAGERFDTTVIAADEQGVTALQFRFHEPLSRAEHFFYIATPDRPAYRLTFAAGARWPAPFSAPPEAEVASFAAEHATWLRERDGYFVVVRIASDFVQSRLLLTGDDAGDGADADGTPVE